MTHTIRILRGPSRVGFAGRTYGQLPRAFLPRPWVLAVVMVLGSIGHAAAQDVPAESTGAETTGPAGCHGLFPLPYVFYQPETGWAGGVGLLHTYRLSPETRLSTGRLFLTYTQKRQYSGNLQVEMATPGNRYFVSAELLGSHFPDLFYGLGNRTRLADEQDYTLDQVRVGLEVRKALGPHLQVGFSPLYQRTRIRDAEPGGPLAAGAILGSDGGAVGGMGAVVVVDSRDDLLAPASGVYGTALARLYRGTFGSDFNFGRYEADVRGYYGLAPGHVLAGQALVTAHGGEPPFFQLARLGGDEVLRGSYEGRYRGQHRAFAQAEYRFPVWRRFGAVVFGGAGQVADEWSELRPRDLRYSGGAGLRFRLSSAERVNLRVDFGVAGRESGVYFGLGEAF